MYFFFNMCDKSIRLEMIDISKTTMCEIGAHTGNLESLAYTILHCSLCDLLIIMSDFANLINET